MNKYNKEKRDNLSFLNKLDDQYLEILDSTEVNENTDSETTDLINFRVINTNNAYPNQNTTDLNNFNKEAKK